MTTSTSLKHLILAGALIATPLSAFADNNVGSCGWGSKLFDGQKGIAPQVLAATTNGTSGNQTFAITSGTSGCTQDGVVRSSWKTAAFIDANMNRLAYDMSRGEGEHLQALTGLLEMNAQESERFAKLTQEKFSTLFAESTTSSEQLLTRLESTLNESDNLQSFAAKL